MTEKERTHKCFKDFADEYVKQVPLNEVMEMARWDFEATLSGGACGSGVEGMEKLLAKVKGYPDDKLAEVRRLVGLSPYPYFKVKDLIKELQQFDPEVPVVLACDQGGTYDISYPLDGSSNRDYTGVGRVEINFELAEGE
jgi:hypothetical protein